MSEKEYRMLASIIGIVMIVFMIFEVLIWCDVIAIDQLGNLGYGLDRLLENPAFVGLLATVVVGIVSGYMENYSMNGDVFSFNKFAETFFYYEPLLILVTQWVPMKESIILLFVIDVLRRAALRLRT